MEIKISQTDLQTRCKKLKWLLLDVDGVLTDGRLYLQDNGEAAQAFHIRDGLGVRMARSAGLNVGILSARLSEAAKTRAKYLSMDAIIQGVDNKKAGFGHFLKEKNLSPDQVAFIGDDLLDMEVLAEVGLGMAPHDAVSAVREQVHVIASLNGGQGAVRELIEVILEARGELEAQIKALGH